MTIHLKKEDSFITIPLPTTPLRHQFAPSAANYSACKGLSNYLKYVPAVWKLNSYIIDMSCKRNRVTLIGPTGSRANEKRRSLENQHFAGVHMRQASFGDISFCPVPASSSLLRLLYAGCLLFRRSWFPFPLSQTSPFCGGKGWFNSSQLRALQRSWQACLPEYVMHTSVYVCLCTRTWVCVHVVEVPCIY